MEKGTLSAGWADTAQTSAAFWEWWCAKAECSGFDTNLAV